MIKNFLEEYIVPSRGETAQRLVGFPGGGIMVTDDDTFLDGCYKVFEFAAWYPEYYRHVMLLRNPYFSPFNRPSPMGSAEPIETTANPHDVAAIRFAKNFKRTEELMHAAGGAGRNYDERSSYWMPLVDDFID